MMTSIPLFKSHKTSNRVKINSSMIGTFRVDPAFICVKYNYNVTAREVSVVMNLSYDIL